VLAVVAVWLLSFFVTWASTEPSPVECDDNPTIVATVCAMPSPSLLPALPAATFAAAVVAAAVPVRRRLRAR